MYQFFQRNQKKLLAVFAAALMIIFILPVGMGRMNGQQDPLAGRVGGEKVYRSQIAEAARQWLIVKGIPTPGEGRGLPLPLLILGEGLAFEIDPDLARRDTPPAHADLYFLLQREAIQTGVRIADRTVEDLASRLAAGARVRDPDELRAAVRGLLLVEALVQRVGGAIKVSEPVVDRFVATQYQTPILKMVEFKSETLATTLPAPTTQELAEQFSRYANVPASQPVAERNPFGFGYVYPNRVQLQYLKIPRAPVMEAVRKLKPDLDWRVRAFEYHRDNPQSFQSTPAPQTQPTSAPASQPTTQPFAEVEQKAITAVVGLDADGRMREIVAAIQERLSPSAVASTQPAGSLARLESAADDIEKQFGVRPEIHSIQNTWLSEQDLAGLRGIGDSFIDNVPFAAYAMQNAEPFLPAAQRQGSAVLSLNELSPPLRDAEQNAYVFALTAAEAAHPPAALSAIEDKVRDDVKRAASYRNALLEATAFAEMVKKSGLEAATQPTSRPIITEDFALSFPNPNTMDLMMFPAYSVGSAGRDQFIAAARDLIAQASKGEPHPVGLIQLPVDGKVLVAQLQGVTPKWSGQNLETLRYYSARKAELDSVRKLREQYFSRDAIYARMNYRSEEKQTAAQPSGASAG